MSIKFNTFVSRKHRGPKNTIHVTGGTTLCGILQVEIGGASPVQIGEIGLSLNSVDEYLLAEQDDLNQKNKVHTQILIYQTEGIEGKMIKPGKYSFPFQILFPDYLLPSFHWDHGKLNTADRRYYLLAFYRKNKKSITKWKNFTTTTVLVHMYRKLPALIGYIKQQPYKKDKKFTFLLTSGDVICNLKLSEQKKSAYFLHFDTIPIELTIENRTKLKIKNVGITLIQRLYIRETSTNNKKGIPISDMIIRSISCQKENPDKFPITKSDHIVLSNSMSLLNSKYITPTVLKKFHTYSYISHKIVVKIQFVKKHLNVKFSLPVFILDPPFEHLSKALKKRKLLKNNKSNNNNNNQEDSNDEDTNHLIVEEVDEELVEEEEEEEEYNNNEETLITKDGNELILASSSDVDDDKGRNLIGQK